MNKKMYTFLFLFLDSHAQEVCHRGLPNLGNTCYMNSVVQLFRSFDHLTDFLLSQEGSRSYKIDTVSQEYINLLDQFRDKAKKIDPSRFVHKVWSNFNFAQGKFGTIHLMLNKFLHALGTDDFNQEHKGKHIVLFNEMRGSYVDFLFSVIEKRDYKEVNYSGIVQLNYLDVDNLILGSGNDDSLLSLSDALLYQYRKNSPRHIVYLPYYLILIDVRDCVDTSIKVNIHNLEVPFWPEDIQGEMKHETYDLKGIIANPGQCHFVSFVRYGKGTNEEWYFFDDNRAQKKTYQEILKFETHGYLDGYCPKVMVYERRRPLEKIVPDRSGFDAGKSLGLLQIELDFLSRMIEVR